MTFDFFGWGKNKRMSWTAAGANNAWLVLDRNQNGRIDNGTEMFGNSMPAPVGTTPINGFTALAQFDNANQGGNGDGVIDRHDAVFSLLRLWTDRNHNGISDPGELSTLDSAGIVSIDLSYHDWHKQDAYGNRLRYRAKFRRSGNGQGSDHWAYDVVLLTEHKQK